MTGSVVCMPWKAGFGVMVHETGPYRLSCRNERMVERIEMAMWDDYPESLGNFDGFLSCASAWSYPSQGV